jgi:hypothetical protein
MEQTVSRLGKGLIAAATVTLLAPAAIGGILTATATEAPAGDAQIRITAAPAKPVQLGALGRANAVAWLSAGHVSAVP